METVMVVVMMFIMVVGIPAVAAWVSYNELEKILEGEEPNDDIH